MSKINHTFIYLRFIYISLSETHLFKPTPTFFLPWGLLYSLPPIIFSSSLNFFVVLVDLLRQELM